MLAAHPVWKREVNDHWLLPRPHVRRLCTSGHSRCAPTSGVWLPCDVQTHTESNEKVVKELKRLAERYDKAVVEEQELPPEKRVVANVGKQVWWQLLGQRTAAPVGRTLVLCSLPVRECRVCMLPAGCQETPGHECE